MPFGKNSLIVQMDSSEDGPMRRLLWLRLGKRTFDNSTRHLGQTAPFRITDIATLHLGPRIVLVTLKIDPSPEMTARELKLGLAVVDEALKAIDARIKYVFFRYC